MAERVFREGLSILSIISEGYTVYHWHVDELTIFDEIEKLHEIFTTYGCLKSASWDTLNFIITEDLWLITMTKWTEDGA